MARYRVIEGIHVEDGKMFNKGDVVTVPDNRKLDEEFKNKFMPLDTEIVESPRDHDDSPDSSGAVMDDIVPKALKKHRGAKPNVALTGITPGDDKNVAGGRRRGKAPPPDEEENLGINDAPEEEEDEEEGETPEEDHIDHEGEGLGLDVTSKFKKIADKAGVVVFQNGKEYFVTEPESPDKPINDKPLTKAKVEDFIKKNVLGK